MGDFNDDPISPSIKDFLHAKGSTLLRNNQMYNTMYDHYKKGIGTLAYRDQWNLFDQFILTPSLIVNPSEIDTDNMYNSFSFLRYREFFTVYLNIIIIKWFNGFNRFIFNLTWKNKSHTNNI